MAIINGTFLPDILLGTSGDDTINGFGGFDTISGGDGDDVIDGGDGDDVLSGGDGNDILIGGPGAATLLSLYNGGNGNDLMIASELGLAEDFDGGDGIDTVSFAARDSGVTTFLSVLGIPLLDTLRNVENVIGSAFSDEITGDGSNNTLDGADGNDVLDGGGGNDVLIGGLGADAMTGGTGNDIYYIDDAGDTVTEFDGSGNDTVRVSTSYTLTDGSSIENAEAADPSATTAVNLTGNAGNNNLTGNNGANEINGAGGADVMGGLGGNDTYYVDNAGDIVVEAPGGGNDRVVASASWTLGDGVSVESLEAAAGTASIYLAGNTLNQALIGNAGNNFLNGGGGTDVLQGLGGNDTYLVDSLDDLLIEGVGEGTDAIYVSLNYVLAAGLDIEELSAFGRELTSPLTLTGNGLAQTIIGNAGNNFLTGGGGADVFYGLVGNDTYLVDSADDLVIEYVDHGNDAVYSSVDYGLAANQHVEVLSAYGWELTSPLTLAGNGFAQTMIGNAGNNFLIGGGGTDISYGFAGNDTYLVDSLDDLVIEGAGQGNDAVYSAANYALTAGQEIELLSTFGQEGTTALNLTGNGFAQALIGNAGANVLDGGAGADILYGLGGNDTFAFTTALGGGNIDVVQDFVAGADKIALDDAVFAGIGGLGTLGADAFASGASATDGSDRISYNSLTGALFFDADGTGGIEAVQFATLVQGLTLSASDFVVI